MKHDQLIIDNISRFEYVDGVLYWKENYGPRSRKGGKVGSIDSSGYLQVHFGSGIALIHRIIWYMFNGTFPEQVDHIDRNRLNNKIENLRASNNSKNQQNTNTRKDNKFNQTGVCLKDGKYLARISINGKRIHLGYFDKLEDAASAYKNAKSIYHNQ